MFPFSIRILSALIYAHVLLSPAFGVAMSPRGDFVANPPLREGVLAPNRRFQFVITAANGHWSDMRSTGTLFGTGGAGRKQLWSSTLPNRYRPRFARVNSSGYTVTFDDWENTKSPNAIVIYDPVGRVVRSYSFDQLVETLGLDPQLVVEKARAGLGWWMGGQPRFDTEDGSVVVPIAGRLLSVRTLDGTLRMK